MTLESRHDFSSNQSKKPFFSPGCARETRTARARVSHSCRVFTYRRVVIQEIPPHGPNPDPRPPRGRRPNDRVVARSSVRRPRASSRVVDVGTSHTDADFTDVTALRRPIIHRRVVRSILDRRRRSRHQPSSSLALGYGSNERATRGSDAHGTRARTRTLPPTFFFARTRLVPDVFAAFTTTRVAETANMTDDRIDGRGLRVKVRSIARSTGGVMRARGGWMADRDSSRRAVDPPRVGRVARGSCSGS